MDIFIKEIMHEAANGLTKSLNSYWPCTHHKGGNALHEANIVLHLAHAFMKRGYYSIYPEASCHRDQNKNFMDLLVHIPEIENCHIVIQAKRFIQKSSTEIPKDYHLIEKFHPNDIDFPENEISKSKNRVRLLVAVTHYEGWKDWWIEDTPTPYGCWRELSEILTKMNRGSVEFSYRGSQIYPSWLVWAHDKISL